MVLQFFKGLGPRLFARLPAPLRDAGCRYAAFSDGNPHTAASISAGGILCAADCSAQGIVGVKEWDSQRTLSLTIFNIGRSKYRRH